MAYDSVDLIVDSQPLWNTFFEDYGFIYCIDALLVLS